MPPKTDCSKGHFSQKTDLCFRYRYPVLAGPKPKPRRVMVAKH
jgi:hypothetical protein